jgi:hypothetical protein
LVAVGVHLTRTSEAKAWPLALPPVLIESLASRWPMCTVPVDPDCIVPV